MNARRRILKIVKPESGGPRPRRFLESTAKRYGAEPALITQMIAAGELVQYGRKRGARWGLPRPKPAI